MEKYENDYIGYWEYDIKSNRLFLSPEMCSILDANIRDISLSYKEALNFISKEEYPMIQAKIKAAINGTRQSFVHQILKKDTSSYYVKSEIDTISDENGYLKCIIGRIEVIDRSVLEKNAFHHTYNEYFELLVENSSEIVQIVNETGKTLYITPNAEKFLYKSLNDLIGKSLLDIIPASEANNVTTLLKQIINQPEKVLYSEIPIFQRNGSIIYFEIAIKNFIDIPYINGIVLNWRDITKLKNIQYEIEHISSHDYLTSLPNKRLFEKQTSIQMEKGKDQSQSFAIMLLDIDRFKHINDTLGHKIGDQLLKAVAIRLKDFLKDKMSIYRFGGDEFAVLLPLTTDTAQSSDLGQQIISILREPFFIDTHEIYITTSLGISLYPFDGNSFEALLKAADIAMYRAKEQGKNQFQLYSSNMNEESYRKFILGNHLNKALEKNELILYYQPQVDPITNNIKGAEALIRWNHPAWGIIPPLEFIHLAEETGLIIPIGEWVLRTACEQLREWKDKGLGIQKVSVNFSAAQFSQDYLVEDILAILSQNDLEPSCLEIEITESILMENQERILSQINKLIEIGVHIAIDDFGTGYSSLGYLKEFKIDTLKIDKSFIKDIPIDSDSIALLTAIINLGKALKKTIIAEGVETGDQVSFLSSLRCDELQGFYFSKPVSAEEFEKYYQ